MRSAWPIVGLLLATPAAAADLSVQATLSDRSARVGDVVTLDVVAVSSINGDIQIELPNVEGLPVIGRNEGTRMSMSFGPQGQQVRREKTVRIELSVDAPGTKQIPPIVARIMDTEAKSAPLSLQVRDEGTVAPVAPPADGQVVPPDAGESTLFARYRLDRNEAWLGQQIVVDLELFAAPGVDFQLENVPDPPELDGFWRETLERPTRLLPREERIGNRTYRVFRAWRLALFPLQAGVRTLDPVTVSLRLGGSFFNSGRRTRLRTLPHQLDIKALPTAGRPRGFLPANVGTYALSASVDRNSVTAGKAVMLSVALSGVGNVKSTRLPEVKAVPGFRVFPPNVKEEVDLRPSGVHGTKRAEILLVPDENGQLKVPALELPIFDPLSGRYETLRSEPIQIQVSGARKAASVAAPAPDTAAPERVERHPVRLSGSLEAPSEAPWRSHAWWLLLGLGPTSWAAGTTFRRARKRFGGDSERRLRAERASEARKARTRLEAAALRPDDDDPAQAFEAALFASARAQFQIELQGLTSDQTEQALMEAGAEATAARAVRAALDEAHFARYAGQAGAKPAAWLEALNALEGAPR